VLVAGSGAQGVADQVVGVAKVLLPTMPPMPTSWPRTSRRWRPG
jgi:hypothetical protein